MPINFRVLASATGLTLLTFTAVAHPASSATRGLSSPGTLYALNSSTAVPSDTYTLGAGDRIQIDIFDAPEYSGDRGRTQVLVDGTLNLPLVGNVSVKGMTLRQAEAELSKRYARYFKRSIVTITLLSARPLTIGILGEVGRPGTYTIPLATQDGGTQFPTLTRALQTAGGITQAADVRRVEIRRPQRVGPPQIITVDLWNYFQSGNLQSDLTLRDGDSVFIAANPNPNLAESLQLADTTFAAEKGKPVNIAIVGEVFRPGAYVVAGANSKNAVAGSLGSTAAVTSTNDKPPTVTQAIQIAGGIKPLADIRKIQIRRLTRAGGQQTIDVDLMKLLQAGDVQQDAILQTGDTITIPTATSISAAEASKIASASFSPDIIRVNVVGEVRQPGVVQVPPNTPLNQALLAAGGFDNRRAKKNSVELIHLNPDGTVVRRKVAIDFSKGINDQTNPAMQNNDIIVVGRSGLAAFGDTIGNVLNPLFPLASFLNIFGL